jgi:UDP-glucose:glycoprotein glucosyltransferase
VWDLKDLGVQATQRIAQASDPLKSLADISQNFPNLASVLSRSKVDKPLRAELRYNQKIIPGGCPLPSPILDFVAHYYKKVADQ